MINQAGSSIASLPSEIHSVRLQTDLAKRCAAPKNYFSSYGIGASLIIGIVLVLPSACTTSAIKGTHFPANVGVGFIAMIIATLLLIITVIALSRLLGFTAR